MATAVKLQSVHGIDAKVLKEEVLDAAFATLREKQLTEVDTANMSLADKVKAMKAYTKVLDKEDPSRIGNCDDCKQPSDAGVLPCCPYCGATDEGEEVEDETAETANRPGAPLQLVAPPVVHEGELVAPSTELDEAVARIRQLTIGTMAGSWAIANEMAAIEKRALWKERRTTDGKVAYKTLEAFAQSELGMTRKYARDLLRIQARYTEEQVRLIGPTKLRLLLSMTPEAEKEVLDAAKGGKGPSKREIARKAGRKGKDEGGVPDGRKNKSTAAPASSGSITIATIEGKRTLKAYCKPANMKTPIEELKLANKIPDVPFAFTDLSNDVRMYIILTRAPDGSLRFVVDTRRIAD